MTGQNGPDGRSPLRSVSVFLATCCYLSLVPLKLFQTLPVFRRYATEKWSGCGLVGSLVGVATYLALPAPVASSPWAMLAGVFISVAVSGAAEKVLGSHDDTRIVIDEWIGAWIAAAAVPHAWGWGIVWAFLLFRLFDVLKGPFAPLQRLPGGWGVTMDDVAAGLAAYGLLRLLPFL